MSHIPRAPRALEQRRALGKRLRAHRLALGYTNKDLADRIGCGTYQVTSMESVCRDVLLGTAIELAEAVHLEVVFAPEFLLPLLDLTADEIDVVIAVMTDRAPSDPANDPLHASALGKLTTTDTTEEPS